MSDSDEMSETGPEFEASSPEAEEMSTDQAKKEEDKDSEDALDTSVQDVEMIGLGKRNASASSSDPQPSTSKSEGKISRRGRAKAEARAKARARTHVKTELDPRNLAEEFIIKGYAPKGDKMEKIPVAERDLRTIRMQKAKGCGCIKKCFKRFTAEEIHACRFGMFEFTKEERDLLILTKLEKMQYRGDIRPDKEEPKNYRYNYTFLGQDICEFTFRFLHNRGPKSFKNLKVHYKTHGVSPRVHGNNGKKPPNAYSFEIIESVVKFVKALAEKEGEADEENRVAKNGHKFTLFSPLESKKSIFAKYLEQCEEQKIKPVGVTLFKSIWDHCLPHIRVSNRRNSVSQMVDVNNN